LRVYEATGSVQTDPGARLSPEELRLQNLEGELSVARSTLSDTNPRVRNLKAQVDALTAQIEASGVAESETQAPISAQETALDISLAEIDSRTKALEQEIQEANAELAELRISIERTPANGIILAGMEREQENIQSLYNGSVARLAAARMSSRVEAASKGERISVLEAASVPDEPSSPNRKQIAALGVLLGLGLAGGLFFLLELLNQVIRRPVDIVKALDITPLATLPNIETDATRRWRRAMQFASLLAVIAMVPTALWAIDTYYMPLDLLFEKIKNPNPFDILRTKAFLLMRQNGWTRMAVTSPNQSCGKSTTACNLAVGLSRQRENRTMLFDMDLRRPNVANLLGCKPTHGMQEMLTGEISPQEQMLSLRGNVALSMAPRPVIDSTQLLLSQHTSDKLDEIQHDFAPDIMNDPAGPMRARGGAANQCAGRGAQQLPPWHAGRSRLRGLWLRPPRRAHHPQPGGQAGGLLYSRHHNLATVLTKTLP